MGNALFWILVALNMALMIFSLVTKSPQERTRSVIRVAALIVFVLLLVTPLVQWSFRWYGLTLLLLVWALFGVWTLFSNRQAAKAFSAKGVVLRTIMASLLIFLAMLPVLFFPQYRLPDVTGPYTVAEVQHTYTDESRTETYADTGEARKVNVSFWYPQDAGSVHPLVVFSHGSIGITTSNEFLYRELASHGYVVASLGHPHHSLWTKSTDGQITFLNMGFFQEIGRENPRIDKKQSYALYQKWMRVRMGDIDFVLDTLLGQAADGAPGVYSLVDIENIGVMGHSLGGSAALGVGRERDDVDAVIALEAPLMFDIVGVENDEFVLTRDAYPVPVLNIYSDSSWEHLSEWTQYSANNALLSDARATAFNVHISGLNHLALTDLSLASPFLTRLLDNAKLTRDSVEGLRIINEVSLEFFDTYLRSQGEFTGDDEQVAPTDS